MRLRTKFLFGKLLPNLAMKLILLLNGNNHSLLQVKQLFLIEKDMQAMLRCQSPVVQRMIKILKAKESSYYPTSQDIFKEVEDALVEAQDIDLYPRPLEKYIQLFQEMEFPKICNLIPALFHTIFLMWSHSTFYSMPAQIVVLLQEFCNCLLTRYFQPVFPFVNCKMLQSHSVGFTVLEALLLVKKQENSLQSQPVAYSSIEVVRGYRRYAVRSPIYFFFVKHLLYMPGKLLLSVRRQILMNDRAVHSDLSPKQQVFKWCQKVIPVLDELMKQEQQKPTYKPIVITASPPHLTTCRQLYLSPENLFKGETEEALEHVKIAKTIFKSFKDSFFSHRNRLESYFVCGKEFKPWDFRSEMLLSRFDMFLNRLLEIEGGCVGWEQSYLLVPAPGAFFYAFLSLEAVALCNYLASVPLHPTPLKYYERQTERWAHREPCPVQPRPFGVRGQVSEVFVDHDTEPRGLQSTRSLLGEPATAEKAGVWWTQGKILSKQVCRMNEEFLESHEVFRKKTYDPGDYMKQNPPPTLPKEKKLIIDIQYIELTVSPSTRQPSERALVPAHRMMLSAFALGSPARGGEQSCPVSAAAAGLLLWLLAAPPGTAGGTAAQIHSLLLLFYPAAFVEQGTVFESREPGEVAITSGIRSPQISYIKTILFLICLRTELHSNEILLLYRMTKLFGFGFLHLHPPIPPPKSSGQLILLAVSLPFHSDTCCGQERACCMCKERIFWEFEDDYTEFKAKTLDLDRRLASVLCVGFHDCSGLESTFKVSTHTHETVLIRKTVLCILRPDLKHNSKRQRDTPLTNTLYLHLAAQGMENLMDGRCVQGLHPVKEDLLMVIEAEEEKTENRHKSSNTLKTSVYRKEIVCSLHPEHNELNLKCRRFKSDDWENHFMPSLLTIFGSFLKKPVIIEIFSPNYNILLEIFDEELDNCRHTALGNMLLGGSTKNGRLLALESPEAAFISQKYVEMFKFLDQYENQTYCEWKVQVDEICQFNLDQPLIKRNPENGLLIVNFDPKLVALLREVKYLLMLNPSIPDSNPTRSLHFSLQCWPQAERCWIFEGTASLDLPSCGSSCLPVAYLLPGSLFCFVTFKVRMASFSQRCIIGNVELIVQLYNRLMQTTLEAEYPLIEKELRTIDDQLKEAEEIRMWQATTCWDCIEQVKTSVCDLEQRVRQSKDNVRSIQGIMNAWMEHALFFRKGKKKLYYTWMTKKKDLLKYTKCCKRIATRSVILLRTCFYVYCNKFLRPSSTLILVLLSGLNITRVDTAMQNKHADGNLKLFKADSSSASWKIYIEYIDDMVDGLYNTVMCSSDFFLENTEESLKPALLFQAQMILNGPEIQFKPSLDKEASDGFYDLVDELLGDVIQMSAQVKSVAAHLGSEHYQLQLLLLCLEIMNPINFCRGIVPFISKGLLMLSPTSAAISGEKGWNSSLSSECKFNQLAGDYGESGKCYWQSPGVQKISCYACLWLENRSEFMKQFLLCGHGLTCTKMPLTDEVSQQPPTIKLFNEQIDICENLYVQISNSEDSKIFESGFKVDTKPFKMSLLNIIKKWSWMFKEHLLRFVIVNKECLLCLSSYLSLFGCLTDLGEFIKVTDAGLQREVTKGDYCVLVEIMGSLLAVKERQTTADELFEPLKEVVALLESYGRKMPGEVYAQLEELPEKWNAVKKRAVSVKHKVTPLHSSEVAVIRRKCTLLDGKQMEFRERFKMEAPFQFGAENAYARLDKANQELEMLEKEMLLMQESAKLFEVAIPDYKQMKQCRKEVWLLKKVWDTSVYINSSIDDWTKTQWRQINVEQMDVQLRRFAKLPVPVEVHARMPGPGTEKMLITACELITCVMFIALRKVELSGKPPKFFLKLSTRWLLMARKVRSWDVYRGLELKMKNLVSSLREILKLCSSTVRHMVEPLLPTVQQGYSIPGCLPADPENSTKLERFSVLFGTGEYFALTSTSMAAVQINLPFSVMIYSMSQYKNVQIITRQTVSKQKNTVRLLVAEDTTLTDLLGLQLHKVEEEIQSIVDNAVKELDTEKILVELSQTWAAMEFSYEEHHRSRTPLLKSDEQLLETLDNNQIQLQAILKSKYVAYFIEQVKGWPNKLIMADSVISIWMEIQRTWSHLESIFTGSEDIRSQLPEDANRFDEINRDFKELLTDMANTKNVMEATTKPKVYEKFEALWHRLPLCEKALAEYLETKHVAFPRFYFVSSADLLDILSKGTQPKQVAHHLTTLFDNIADLKFQENIQESVNTALGMYSREKEYVPLYEGCGCSGQVSWLQHLEETVHKTVRLYIMEATAYEEKQREQWVFDYPAQVALTGSQIWWVSDVEMAFSRLEEGLASALKDCHKKQVTQLNALITVLLGELSSGDRQKIMTICTIDAHARDDVASLVAQKVTSSRAFAWLSQLCCRWDDAQKHCFANICDAQFQYFYEYLGNTPRLVTTPLTDRCYITLTHSLHLTMSGAPAGPASTGRTETTKDLGRALGMMVYLFNCSEQMDYKYIYKGLVQTAAWGCFDEFNRVSVEVLSVVAVQVKTIHNTIRNKKKKFLFLGENITLKSSVGIFITMNPGYADQTELPENFKTLFRPCAMVVPDIELISEIMLVAEGFIDASLLARKFITLYTLCGELLSKQEHYGWALRAIKSVLVVAGSLTRGDKTRPEGQVLMRALRDFNLPQIVTDDIPIFTGLITDLFPALDVPRKRNLQFEQMVKQSTLELLLQPEESFILKVVQQEELLAVRHSVFVVRNSRIGKSKVLKLLLHMYMNMKQKPVWNDLDPKVLTADELFGFIHHATQEWKDGLLSCLLREQANITHEGPKWLVLDGDIDPMWVESLNTAMDDNKVLTLTSNERVPMTPSMMWLLFEVHHLRAATPAAVSRAGVLYLNTQDLGWNLYVASIETRRNQSEKANLTVLFDKYVPPYLEQLRTRFKTVTPIPANSMVQTLRSLLDCLLTPENVPMDCPRELYEMYFVFACIWAFGGALAQDQLNYQAEFSCWWLKKMKEVKFPSQGTVFNYYLDPEKRKFLPWVDKVLSPDVDPDAPLQAIFVPTSETARLKYCIDLTKGKPVILVGNAGVGKTVFVGDRLAALSGDYLLANIPLNYYTPSAVLQKMLGKKLEKKAGRNYGPVGNKKLIYFIDDLNMPEVDRHGTVQLHALIQQHIDHGHWYDRKLTIKEIHNCQYIACMNPTAGSFTINPRLQRHFAVFALNFPSSDSLTTIYTNIVCFDFQQHAFTSSVIKNIPAIVQAAILHQVVVQNFPPTAIKFHYIFNMRDFSNIFQGILFATPMCLQQPNDLQRLWLHESARAYGDKLVENKDCNFFYKIMMDTMHKYFENVEDQVLLQSLLIYCHFANGRADPCYKPVKGWELLRNILEEFLESYNEMHASVNLVLFEGAMWHVCWISRILEAPRGYALLIGVGGSAKQSLSRLAAYICSLEVFQITLKKDYGIRDLSVDLASLYIKTGAKNMPMVFLLTDAQVPDERFLVLINDLLASGEVPDLFSDEDVEGLVTGVRKEVRALGLVDTRESCWILVSRVRLQLKIVLCFSPAGATLRAARKFPAIVNCTTIDWFHEWLQEALHSISRRFIEEAEGVEPLIQDPIYDFMAYAHTSVNMLSAKYNRNERQYNYTTPKTFLEQIMLYKILLEKKSKEMSGHMEYLVNGMQKLKAATFQAEDLKSKLASQEAELQLRNQDADALIAKIGFQTEKVSQEKAIADAEEQKVAAIQGEVYLRQKECEDDLLKAEPALVAATAALDMLNKVNLTELKAFANPPMAVINVIAAVMVLLACKGKVPKDRSWKAAKVFMGKVDDFLQALINYDKEHIPQNCLKVVKEHYLKDPDFSPNYVRTKSFAAAGLCAWVISITKFLSNVPMLYVFFKVYCEVEPKRAQANAELAAATEKLEAVRKKLLVLDSGPCKLTASLEKAVAEKVRCQDDVNQTNKTIELANRMVKGLESENMRWSQSVENLKAQKKTLCGDVLLTAVFVSFLGPFTKQYRQELMEHFIPFLKSQKVPIPVTEGLDPIATLTDDAMIAAWSNKGLPGDRMSTENATILTNCKRWPLMIDPQQQGIKWIKNKYGADLKVIRLGQKGYLKTIERALACGEIVLIENMGESIDSILDPLLGRHTVKKGKYIKIEDKECEFNKNFHLILHTKLADPHYKPELQAQTTLINFTVTRDGLEDQLLAEVVSAERPDLEKQCFHSLCSSVLAKQQNCFKTELRQLEDDMLLSLSAAQGSFLDNSELVEQLKSTKSSAAEIQHKVVEAKENEAEINVTREHYRPTAIRASILYFFSNSLGSINPVYRFSLKAFNAVFHKAIKQAEKSRNIQCRISNLTEAVTYSTFLFTSQGLFEKDKLIFLAQTAFQILLRTKEIEFLESDFLLQFRVEHTYESPVDLTTQSWSAVRAIAVMDVFKGLDKDTERSTKRKWVDSECPEKEKLLQEWTNKSSLQKLIILRVLRPDRMTYALRNFVEEKLRSRYVESTRMDLAKSYEESSPATPVFFILSPGADPLKDIETLGKKLGFTVDSGRFHNISLGQGQEMVAEKALEKAAKHGHWVLFQNIHLVAKWLGTLEKLLEQYSEESHPDFHVFISAEPAPTPEKNIIPQGILENSIKITSEPPTGMLANLQAALYSFDQDTLELCTREVEFKSILFSLCYFHTCIAGKLKFGPQGWNGRYLFSARDLAICITVLCNYLETHTEIRSSGQVPWEDLHYLFGEIMHGGHITDAWDCRLRCIYLQEFISPPVLEGELAVAPGFLAPPNLDYAGYHKYIDEMLPSESPVLYGLHPNAEMGYLTTMSDNLFKTLLEMQPINSFIGEGSGQSAEEKVKNVLDDVLEMLPKFNMAEIMQKTTAWSPYALVCLQECERMSLLLSEVRRSLKQLDLSLKGELMFSPHMEVLQSALFYDAVPDTWTELAHPSTYSLDHLVTDLLMWYGELDSWTQDLVLPAVVWLSGLFNPQSFLTDVMQSTACKNNWPLDKVCLTADLVTKKTKEDYGHPPREGYICGLFVEARTFLQLLEVQNRVSSYQMLKVVSSKQTDLKNSEFFIC
ncbi:LOW QUALITY PROTEIN: dynein axonemal heavy chain 11 [Sarcoramphus papa]